MKTRKLTSVVLVLCLVTSLVSMCFVGTVSAKTVNANVAGNQYETVLNLTFDGEYYTVKIPEALRPYMGGKTEIKAINKYNG